MEGSRRDPPRKLTPFIAVCFVLGLIGTASLSSLHLAFADGGYTPLPTLHPKADVSVNSGPNGVTIYLAVTESSPGTAGNISSTTTNGSGGGWSCSANIMNIGNASRAWFQSEAPLHPDQAPWVVTCTNGFVDVVWLPNNTAPSNVSVVVRNGATVDPATIAAELRDQVPVPPITIGVNPSTGLVAVPSWFWIQGYDGASILASDTLEGTSVDVEIAPSGYTWSFGDGASMQTASLGQRYPTESDIRHTYQQSSLSAGGAFSVTVEITFSARYRVNGGDWLPLDPITRTFTLAYPVQQVQSILTGR